MTAQELLRQAVTCVTCQKIHEPRKTGNYMSWAGEDGHAPRTLIFAMTGASYGPAIKALRQIADPS